MSNKPVVARKGRKLQLNEAAKAILQTFADKHHVDSDEVLADLERGQPAAQLLLKILNLAIAPVQNGRPRDEARFRTIYEAVKNNLSKTRSLTAACRLASVDLLRMGIAGPDGEPLTEHTIRRNYGNLGRFYFEELPEP